MPPGGKETWSGNNLTSYGYNGNVFTVAYQGWGSQKRFPAYISDGTSQTVFFADKAALTGTWNSWYFDSGQNFWADWGPSFGSIECGNNSVQPTGLNAIWWPVGKFNCIGWSYTNACVNGFAAGGNANSPHMGGINVGMGDGSVRTVAQGISPLTWWNSLTPNAGDLLGPDW
jgi:prepilin-type processing-associated H-X9-DG protein